MGQPDWYNISLKIFLKNSKGEILSLKENNSRTTDGFYDFPGGRIDPDEFTVSYEDIIRRELAEEIGTDVKYKLTLKPVSFARHNYFSERQNKDVRILLLFFEAEYLGGDIQISTEHTGYDWLDFKNIDINKYFIKGCLEAVRRYLALFF